MNNIPDIGWATQERVAPSRSAGVRLCPNPECHGLIFVVFGNNSILRSFPPELIDFDASALPQNVRDSLTEAVLCHSAGAYKAAALMIRRVLEELCADRGASGKDLKERIQNLSASAIVPKELLDAADELRLLGNDAAHVEAKAYDDIGDEEATLAIDLAKELLKAVYQYADLVSKLKALRKK